MFEYKVLTQKDRIFSGRFDAARLERVLNELAADGWRLVQAEATTLPAFLSKDREEMLVILERQVE